MEQLPPQPPGGSPAKQGRPHNSQLAHPNRIYITKNTKANPNVPNTALWNVTKTGALLFFFLKPSCCPTCSQDSVWKDVVHTAAGSTLLASLHHSEPALESRRHQYVRVGPSSSSGRSCWCRYRPGISCSPLPAVVNMSMTNGNSSVT